MGQKKIEGAFPYYNFPLTGFKGHSQRGAKTPIAALQLFLDEEIINMTTKCSNEYIEKVKESFLGKRMLVRQTKPKLEH